MNKVILIGRLTKDPAVTTTQKGNEPLNIARYSLAVDRIGKDAGADFISCVAFGKSADFASKYLTKGIKIAVEGRIQTGSYDKDGTKVYTTDVIVDKHEFCEKAGTQPTASKNDDFMAVADGLESDGLPFN